MLVDFAHGLPAGEALRDVLRSVNYETEDSGPEETVDAGGIYHPRQARGVGPEGQNASA